MASTSCRRPTALLGSLPQCSAAVQDFVVWLLLVVVCFRWFWLVRCLSSTIVKHDFASTAFKVQRSILRKRRQRYADAGGLKRPRGRKRFSRPENLLELCRQKPQMHHNHILSVKPNSQALLYVVKAACATALRLGQPLVGGRRRTVLRVVDEGSPIHMGPQQNSAADLLKAASTWCLQQTRLLQEHIHRASKRQRALEYRHCNGPAPWVSPFL